MGLFSGYFKKLREKIDMYDMILANFAAGSAVIPIDAELEGSNISIGFSHMESQSQINKYFVITGFPMYLNYQIFDEIRNRCIGRGIKINFYMYSEPHTIKWDSSEMRNRMDVWKRLATNKKSENAFDYRTNRGANIVKDRIMQSTEYFNKAELDWKRTLFRTAVLIEFVCRKDDESRISMIESLQKFKSLCGAQDIKVKELKVNLMDWMSQLGIFCLKGIREVASKIPYRVYTDDVMANFNSYKQGRVGYHGICLGIDVSSRVPVMKKFKDDPDASENWLVSAESGGGKSYFVKTLQTYLLADGFVVTIMDYEGDEYLNLAAFVGNGCPEDVKVISMGKGSSIYFDPMEIAELTGDPDIDCDLRENALAFTMSIFRVLTCGLTETMNMWEESVLSKAIQRVYDEAGVTPLQNTWARSKGLRIAQVYEEIKYMVESKELVDPTNENLEHKAAARLATMAAVYFEPGATKFGTFEHPMSVNELFQAKLIIFSFGMKGATSSQIDPVILALKQLSVANVSIQISNHCKYIRRCFNVKVWEEFQRWGEVKGSADIISNAMTGGRKRGDVNILITNDLASILDEDNKVATRLRQNFNNMAIGRIRDKNVRKQFCEKFGRPELLPSLEKIAQAHADDTVAGKKSKGTSNSKYRWAFCLMLDNGKQAIVKVLLPRALRDSKLFKTGVDVDVAIKTET